MKNEWPTVSLDGKTFRVCRAKWYMLSRCLYCSFSCGAVKRANAIPGFLRCNDGIYFKRIDHGKDS